MKSKLQTNEPVTPESVIGGQPALDWAFWSMSPAWLNPTDGPWGTISASEGIVNGWKKILDWCAARGVPKIFANVAPSLIDPLWNFHWYLNFPNHPEARMHAPDLIARRQKSLRAIFRMARERQIEPWIFTYNLLAPSSFVMAHPSVRKKLELRWGEQCPDGIPGTATPDHCKQVVGELCWREPVVREFTNATWAETFETFEDLSGIMLTAGENVRCLCSDCIPEPENQYYASLWVFDRTKIPNIERNMIEMVEDFDAVSARYGRESIVRTWRFLEQTPPHMLPERPTYILKYSNSDCHVAAPNPLTKEWWNSGRKFWFSAEYQGENCGPWPWANDGYVTDVVSSCGKLGAKGVTLSANTMLCQTHHGGKLHSAMFSHFIRKVQAMDPYACEGIRHDLTELLSPDFISPVLAAMEVSSRPLFDLSRIFGPSFEGYTYCWPYGYKIKDYERYSYFPMGELKTDAPDFARGCLLPLSHFFDGAKAGRVDPEWEEGGDPEISLLARLRANEAAVKEEIVSYGEFLDSLPADAPDRGDLELLASGLEACREVCRLWLDLIPAALYYRVARSNIVTEARKTAARRSLELQEAALHYLERAPARFADLSPYCDNLLPVGYVLQSAFAHREVRRKEYLEIRAEFQESGLILKTES